MAKPRQGTYGHFEGKTCVACAVGTILLGAGQSKIRENRVLIRPKHYGIVSTVNQMVPRLMLRCPYLDCLMHPWVFPIGELAENLFEDHHWSRPRIATYIERQIKAYEKEQRA